MKLRNALLPLAGTLALMALCTALPFFWFALRDRQLDGAVQTAAARPEFLSAAGRENPVARELYYWREQSDGVPTYDAGEPVDAATARQTVLSGLQALLAVAKVQHIAGRPFQRQAEAGVLVQRAGGKVDVAGAGALGVVVVENLETDHAHLGDLGPAHGPQRQAEETQAEALFIQDQGGAVEHADHHKNGGEQAEKHQREPVVHRNGKQGQKNTDHDREQRNGKFEWMDQITVFRGRSLPTAANKFIE